ncbi:MAG TPA: ZIP family zinc transporter [Candidatus Limnocylindria bacterium]|nr:ZIP family zinc transporter [Candidatus Limnocylindria bacterium]
MIAAGLWGLAAASTLVIGALIGLYVPIKRRWVAMAMGFGAGALISALAFDLTEEAFSNSNAPVVAAGLAAGALTFYLGNRLIDEARRGENVEPAASSNGLALALGALLDGIPESVVLGTTLLSGGAISIPFLVAVAISNLPEGLSAASDLRREGHSPSWIMRLWVVVALASGLAAAIGYGVLGDMGPFWVPLIQAFAAGAILTMLVDTMIPEAYEGGGGLTGLVTVAGFALAFFLTAVE